MRRLFLGLTLVSAIALLAPAPAAAQDRADKEQRFRDRDANGDGVLTRGEYGGHIGNFRALDRDENNELTLDEFMHMPRASEEEQPGVQPFEPAPADPSDQFATIDANRDGVLQRGEWRSAEAGFKRRDHNGDGVLSRGEFDNPDLGDTAMKRDPGGVEGVRNRGFASHDRNRDGRIDRNEWRGGLEAFSLLDRNGDKRLTPAEYDDAARARQRFRDYDRDGSGRIQRNEWRGTAREFEDLDSDRNGQIAGDEFY